MRTLSDEATQEPRAAARPHQVRAGPDRRGQPVGGSSLRSAFDNAPIGMAVVTPTGVIINCNEALATLLGRTPDELVGGTFFDVTHPSDLPVAHLHCEAMQHGGLRVLAHECRFVRADELTLWVQVSTSRVPEAPGHPAHLIMHIQDISDRKALEAELTHRALHDPLTGLPNRTLLMDRLEHALGRSRRSANPTCVFFLDLNEFKTVNDTFGHGAGDSVLKQLAARLAGILRPGDTAARLGGDEFVILCENTDTDQAAVIAGRLRDAAAEPFTLDGHSVLLTAAVGVTTSDVDPDGVGEHDPETILRRADRQMYAAKPRRGAR